MILDGESMPLCDGRLALFDDLVDELHDLAALDADQVVMVSAAVDLEYGLAAFEVVPANQSHRFELSQHPVDRGQPDLLAILQQHPIHILGGDMAFIAPFQQGQDLYAG